MIKLEPSINDIKLEASINIIKIELIAIKEDTFFISPYQVVEEQTEV